MQHISSLVACSLFACFAGTLSAQTMTMTAMSWTNITAIASTSGLPAQVQTVPAGLIVPTLDLHVVALGSTGQAVANVRHYVHMGEREAVYEMQQETAIAGSNSQLASTGPHEVMLTLLPSAPMEVVLELVCQMWSSHPTGSLPLFQIDVDNDGTFEFQTSSNSTVFVRRSVSGQHVVRVRAQQAVAGSGTQSTWSLLHVRVRRDLRFDLHELTTPCSLGGMVIEPTFASELRFGLAPTPANVSGLGVVVLGTAMQPFLWPTPQPCIGVPRIDAVIVTPGDGVARLLVPPGLGAFTLFAQGVVLSGSGQLFPSIAFETVFH